LCIALKSERRIPAVYINPPMPLQDASRNIIKDTSQLSRILLAERDVRPNCGGIVPFRLFKHKSSQNRFTLFLISGGMTPVSLLLPSCRTPSLGRLKRLGGIVPVKLLSDSDSHCSILQFESSAGILPATLAHTHQQIYEIWKKRAT
jgi:hypothetical protein